MSERRPWDALVRDDLHARGDRVPVDVEPALQSVLRTSRRRRRRDRGLAATVLVAVGAVAVVVAMTVGLPSGGKATVPATTATPQPTPAVTGPATALLREWTRTVAPTEATASAPVAWRGPWSMTPLEDGTLTLSGPAGGPDTDGVGYQLAGDRLRVNAFANGVCGTVGIGTYRWSLSGDLLRLDVVDEPCPERAVVFAGTWGD